MKATEETSIISADVKADLEAVIESITSGKPLDPEVARRVRERGDRIREETFQKHGLLDIAVPAIRELRGALPTSGKGANW